MRIKALRDCFAEIGDVGIEMEFTRINRNNNIFGVALHRKLPGYKVEHDASSESYAYVLNHLPIVAKTEFDKRVMAHFSGPIQRVIGGELVSPLVLGEDWIKDMHKLTDVLLRFGETSETLRDSLHVHVNLGNSVPLSIVKRLLRIVMAYEAILYRLGGLGTKNRGEDNQYTYQRPYLGHGPPVYKKHGVYYPICNPYDLLDAENKHDFFDKLGSTVYHMNEQKRYVTHRYFGVNLYTVPSYGSIEFRHANKCLNPQYIIAWISLCKAIVRKAFYKAEDNTEKILRPLYDNRVIPSDEFLTVLETLDLSNETITSLFQIWEESPTPKFDNIHRTSHLKSPTFFQHTNYLPDQVPMDEQVKRAIYLDIHGLHAEKTNVARIGEIFPNLKKKKRNKPEDNFAKFAEAVGGLQNNVANFVEIGDMPQPQRINARPVFAEDNANYHRPDNFIRRVKAIHHVNLNKLEPNINYCGNIFDDLYIDVIRMEHERGVVNILFLFTDEEGMEHEYIHTIDEDDIGVDLFKQCNIKNLCGDVYDNPEEYFDM